MHTTFTPELISIKSGPRFGEIGLSSKRSELSTHTSRNILLKPYPGFDRRYVRCVGVEAKNSFPTGRSTRFWAEVMHARKYASRVMTSVHRSTRTDKCTHGLRECKVRSSSK